MDKNTGNADERRMISESALDQLIREGARKMLQSALDNEVAEFIERMKSWLNLDRKTVAKYMRVEDFNGADSSVTFLIEATGTGIMIIADQKSVNSG